MLRLERTNGVRATEGQTDVIPAVDQPLFARGRDIKGKRKTAIDCTYLLCFEINRHLKAWERSAVGEQPIHLNILQADDEQAVVQRIGIKNIAERRRDDHEKTSLLQRPRRMFAR